MSLLTLPSSEATAMSPFAELSLPRYLPWCFRIVDCRMWAGHTGDCQALEESPDA